MRGRQVGSHISLIRETSQGMDEEEEGALGKLVSQLRGPEPSSVTSVNTNGTPRITVVDITPVDGKESMPSHELGGQAIGIGFLGGITLLINSITGPGMMSLPLAFVKGGVLYCILLIVVMSVVSSTASLMLCQAIKIVTKQQRREMELLRRRRRSSLQQPQPQQQQLDSNPLLFDPDGGAMRWEYCTLVSHFFGTKMSFFLQAIYNMSLQVMVFACALSLSRSMKPGEFRIGIDPCKRIWMCGMCGLLLHPRADQDHCKHRDRRAGL